MNIKVNNESLEFGGKTIADLAKQLCLPEKGVAIAVSMQMVPRSEWQDTVIQDGADIIVIKAASGG